MGLLDILDMAEGDRDLCIADHRAGSSLTPIDESSNEPDPVCLFEPRPSDEVRLLRPVRLAILLAD